MLRDIQVAVVGKVFKPNPNKVLALNRTLNEYFKLVNGISALTLNLNVFFMKTSMEGLRDFST